MNSLISKQHCNNCGKFGHVNKICKDPITSIGILCIKLEDNKLLSKFDSDEYFNIIKYNDKNNKCMSFIEDFNEKFKFLMIKRKHSLGFLEFVRGRYEVTDYQKIVKFFEHMSEEEIDLIKTKEFDEIWSIVWKKTAHLKAYEEEYTKSSEKFEILKYKNVENNVLGLKFFTDNILPKWKNGEWGFPKGRRSYHEKNITCAVREFEEETGYTSDDYEIINSILPLKEVFMGTNGLMYKHIYYIAILKNDKEPEITEDNNEVGEIGWFSYSKASSIIRNYHIEKKKVLNELFKFLVSLSLISEIKIDYLETPKLVQTSIIT